MITVLEPLRRRLHAWLAPFPGDRPSVLFRCLSFVWQRLRRGSAHEPSPPSGPCLRCELGGEAPPSPPLPGPCLRCEPGNGLPPLISVVVPVFRPNLAHLQAAIDSVRQQTYPHWELRLCDDGSNNRQLTRLLEAAASEEPRIRWQALPENRGISAASNAAVAAGTGDYVAFLDQDDILAPDALAWIAAVVERGPADILYSDWDRIDERGLRSEPFHKPAWSPDLLRGMMYVAHLTVYRRAFLEQLGGFRSAFDGAQDWELALRAAACTDRVVHIPRVLYHWRSGGVSSGRRFNRLCHERGRLAVAESLLRGGEAARLEDGPVPCTFHVRYPPPRWPRVSILIPTRDNLPLLRRCLDSLRRRTRYPDWEVLIVDNGSRRPDVRRYLQSCGARLLRVDEPFNHSRLNNLAARQARGELLLLLNDDTEVLNRGWLRALAEQALRPDIGAAGAWLFHPDGRTQHAGIVLGQGRVAQSLNAHLLGDGLDRGTVRLVRDTSAVTAACLMIRKGLYLEVGGLDEDELPTSFNDVDLCLRLRKAGYRCVVTPLARLYHHESATRTIGDESRFEAVMRRRWAGWLEGDPWWTAGGGNRVLLPLSASLVPAATVCPC